MSRQIGARSVRAFQVVTQDDIHWLTIELLKSNEIASNRERLYGAMDIPLHYLPDLKRDAMRSVGEEGYVFIKHTLSKWISTKGAKATFARLKLILSDEHFIAASESLAAYFSKSDIRTGSERCQFREELKKNKFGLWTHTEISRKFLDKCKLEGVLNVSNVQSIESYRTRDQRVRKFYTILLKKDIDTVRPLLQIMSQDDVKQHDLVLNVIRNGLQEKGCSPTGSPTSLLPSRDVVPDFSLIPDDLQDSHKDIWFEVTEPPPLFTGRDSELECVHKIVMDIGNTAEVADLASQLIVIFGPAGVGKTSLVRKYAHQYAEHFRNVAWINAETPQDMDDSLVRLHSLIRQGNSNGAEASPFDSTEEICRHFEQRTSLFIFDNAEEYMFEAIRNFLAQFQISRQTMTYFLITSRTNANLIPNYIENRLEVNVLALNNAIDLVKNELELQSHALAEELALKLENIPLALQLGIVCVQNSQQLGRVENPVQEFLTQFGRNRIVDSVEFEHSFGKTVLSILLLSFERIRTYQIGNSAIELVRILSYFDENNINADIFNGYMNRDGDELEAINLLAKFSIIKIRIGTGLISINRLVQCAIRAHIAALKEDVPILRKALQLMKCYTWEHTMHRASLWSHVLRYDEIVREFPEFGINLCSVADIENDINVTSFQNTLVKFQQLFSGNDCRIFELLCCQIVNSSQARSNRCIPALVQNLVCFVLACSRLPCHNHSVNKMIVVYDKRCTVDALIKLKNRHSEIEGLSQGIWSFQKVLFDTMRNSRSQYPRTFVKSLVLMGECALVSGMETEFANLI